ncbi:MAG TPA: peptide chain release factor N(5)-glutamine methyltransferase [Vicinamibacterales bacterium]
MRQDGLDGRDGLEGPAEKADPAFPAAPALPAITSIHQHVAQARGRFREAGLSSKGAELDARLLAQYVLGWSIERFITCGNEPEPPDFAHKYETLVERRLGREPLAYIVGRQEFWGLSFEVSPAVLIPRHETELIVEVALELFPDRDRTLTVADLGTGSGCVAVAIASERPAARITATDISSVALEVARQNATRHGVADRIQFRSADLLDGLEGPFDLIACNPPYVAERDRRGLQPEVRDHEPDVALYGGTDGFHLVERLVHGAAVHLRPGGYLLFEFGLGQDERIESLIGGTGNLRLRELRRDLQGIARTAVVERV